MAVRHERVEPDEQTAWELAIVLRAQSDPRAFEPLYRAYLGAIVGFCRQRSPDDDSAWDADGQTFAKALAGLYTFDGDAFAPWLYRIAENCCRDLARARARRPTVPLPDELEMVGNDPDPITIAIATDNARRLEEALTRLTPRREQIVRLRLSGLKGREIALRLGISHDLVRKEQERAIDNLADLLGADP